MDVFNYDPSTGKYISTTPADPSPLEPGVYLVPAHATTVPVPAVPAGRQAIWANDEWTVQLITAPYVPQTPIAPPSAAPALEPVTPKLTTTQLRAAAYQYESDPIFFKWQRGEATQADWLAAVAAVKTRFPN
jgi:hypothetical protein